MNNNESKSEVAQLRKQIELECESMKQALYGYAVVASHEAINHKYNNLGVYQKELEQHVGVEEANSIVVETYINVVG